MQQFSCAKPQRITNTHRHTYFPKYSLCCTHGTHWENNVNGLAWIIHKKTVLHDGFICVHYFLYFGGEIFFSSCTFFLFVQKKRLFVQPLHFLPIVIWTIQSSEHERTSSCLITSWVSYHFSLYCIVIRKNACTNFVQQITRSNTQRVFCVKKKRFIVAFLLTTGFEPVSPRHLWALPFELSEHF